MNSLIAGARNRVAARPIGGDSRGGVDQAVLDRNARALSDLEAAERRGDPDEIAFAEHVLAKRIDESRAARGAEDRPRDPETGQYIAWDGGARREPGMRRPTPGVAQETANQLMLRAMTQSRVERAESGAEATLIAHNT